MSATGSTSKPNIVLVMMDNFGYGEIGVYGGGALRGAPTPNIDGIVHMIDLFPTLANYAGGSIPQDRVLDGVDQSQFLSGKSDGSARESMVIYIGNELFGVKWRNWKMLLKELDEETYAIQKMAYPSIYNLLVDPKEEEPETFYLDDTWVDTPLWQVLEEHEASIEADPGAPEP